MGVTAAIARAATRRVHVLIVEVPGHSLLRMHAQVAISEMGWVEAIGPADADALLVCGSPTGILPSIIDAVWAQIPSPRHRVVLTDTVSLTDALIDIPVALRDDKQQRRDAGTRRLTLDDARGPDPADSADGESMPNEHGETRDADGDMDTDMDMDMDMSGPAGIALAGGDQDRDGLEMDVTHLSIGPILPAWPADLIVHATLHGDVVADARIERIPRSAEPEQPPVLATLIDDAARLLEVAGWEPTALSLARIRGDLITGRDIDRLRPQLRRTLVRVRRSRTLRWSLAGIDAVQRGALRIRLLAWLDTALELLESPPKAKNIPEIISQRVISENDLRVAIVGRELSETRLIVAGLGTHQPRQSAEVTHE
ncbi:hypothetical protein F1C58_04370 [Glaciihabitans sp. INWT7]|uniref:hypothetical protein n=1 Tax=Glaciihabitans sp. INWT7 TaxID=2596912 RepID=UPI0016276531|nr:hypothetical protein [Glaciihabitans sp. INWT7]QNE46218.1 hypothetical protein F1C58_04370 [Glaciihabitans sp. INWT7]